MQVKRAGYYLWLKGTLSNREIANEQLLVKIKEEFDASDETYGSPRITKELRAAGIQCNEKRIARLMRVCGLVALAPRKFVVTTDSDHKLPVAENLLNREFDVKTINTNWNCDITYIWTREGWLYLAVVIDLFSRRVVGWAMSDIVDRFLVINALEMAIRQRRPDVGLLCHSDQGSQYASGDYQDSLKAAGITCSMSRRGDCWDNAPVESFFATLKKEMVHRTKFETREQASTAVFGWIEVWYNRKRRHSSLGYLSPEMFERQNQPKQPTSMAA